MVDALIAALQDKYIKVRIYATQSLGSSMDLRAVEPLIDSIGTTVNPQDGSFFAGWDYSQIALRDLTGGPYQAKSGSPKEAWRQFWATHKAELEAKSALQNRPKPPPASHRKRSLNK